MIYEEKERRIE